MEKDMEILKDFLELKEIHSSNGLRMSYLTIYQEAVKNLIARYKQQTAELEKKEAIINEMANIISAIMTGITAIQNQFEEEYCEFIKSDEDCCWKTEKKCTDCIKEYFTKKVEGK